MKTLQFALALLVSTFLFTSCFTEGGLVCTKPHGENVTNEIPVDQFDRLDLQMQANVVLTQGNEYKVEVDAAENIQKILVANISSNELTLRTERGRCIRGNSNVTFYITCPNIEGITLSGSGNIVSAGPFSGENLELRISGSGNIELDDFSYENNMVGVTGSGDLRLNNFEANDAELKTSGSGKIEYLNASIDNVDASITGSGKIILDGEDASYFNLNVSGSGKVEGFNMQFDIADVKIGGSGRVELNVVDELNATITGSGDVYYLGNPSVKTNITGSGKVKRQN